MPTDTIQAKQRPNVEAFRERAAELRRLANRPEPSSLRGALLSAAQEWDDLANRISQRHLKQGE